MPRLQVDVTVAPLGQLRAAEMHGDTSAQSWTTPTVTTNTNPRDKGGARLEKGGTSRQEITQMCLQCYCSRLSGVSRSGP
jgi:hypothetical protein